MKTCLALAVFTLALVVEGAVDTGSRTMLTMDPLSLSSFINTFGEALLNKIAVEVNSTADLAAQLEPRVNICAKAVAAQQETCTLCATNKCSSSPNLGDVILGGLKLANPIRYLEPELNKIGSTLGVVIKVFGKESVGFLSTMNALGDWLGTLGGEFESAYGELKRAFSSKSINKGIESLRIDIKNVIVPGMDIIKSGFTSLGSTIGGGFVSAGKFAGDFVGGIFSGRRRRDISAADRACMRKCDSCAPFLLSTQDEIIEAVCGPEITAMNATLQAKIERIAIVYDALIDNEKAIVEQIRFDPKSMDPTTWEYTFVTIKTNVSGVFVEYQTSVTYSPMNLPTTATLMALEYWEKN
ncbi:uncharacterized protein LOC128219213 [Mya arenaria]|uniref:uncharacterized protein LOC128219213 n=1 Tax=Mya arenaria TaxID=6604 RepID=UPI0022E64604|nr:uncharacterized protein LOC128219213 [Mya arenaria]